MLSYRTREILLFTTAAVVTAVFFINVCELVFQCGCNSLWAGLTRHCNIHDANLRHCPWCQAPVTGAVAWLGVTGAQAGIVFRCRQLGPTWRLLLALLAFPLIAATAAGIAGVFLGYWR